MIYNSVYLSLGSNIGEKELYLLNAILEIEKLNNTKIIKISEFYSTTPVGFIDQDSFINCAVFIKTKLTPYNL